MRATFDLAALHDAVDQQRQARGMSWAQVATAVRMSVSTIMGLGTRASAEGDGVLQLLLWLGRTADSFVVPAPPTTSRTSFVRPSGNGIVRFNAHAIYSALDTERVARGITWRDVAAEVGSLSPASLTRLRDGGRVMFPAIVPVFRWLGQPAEQFVHVVAHRT